MELFLIKKINGTNIPHEKQVTLWGITINENLKFDKPVSITYQLMMGHTGFAKYLLSKKLTWFK